MQVMLTGATGYVGGALLPDRAGPARRWRARTSPTTSCTRWGATGTSPSATGALRALATHPDPPPEVQLGGADVLTYREMMVRFARLTGRRPPAILRTPLLSPTLSSYWVALVTPVELGLVRPLVDGLSAEMLVRVPPPPGINDRPADFDTAVRRALGA